nr:hypothetical protein JVH1_1772 [Rhodococcus sp. JVH1]
MIREIHRQTPVSWIGWGDLRSPTGYTHEPRTGRVHRWQNIFPETLVTNETRRWSVQEV